MDALKDRLSFNSQPPEGGWANRPCRCPHAKRFNSQPPEGGWALNMPTNPNATRFNSQPPEGGWQLYRSLPGAFGVFQLTAARRRLVEPELVERASGSLFQLTAARRRLANQRTAQFVAWHVSTHSRPKAAGDSLTSLDRIVKVSTHSRPKAAGNTVLFKFMRKPVSTHSRPKAAGYAAGTWFGRLKEFQLTAARRRLGSTWPTP